MYFLDSTLSCALHVQLYNALKEDILHNFKSGDKMPSIRKVSQSCNVSKNTVESAYSQLVVEGYIDSFPKSGYVVLDIKELVLDDVPVVPYFEEKPQKIFQYDFSPARLEKGIFPMKLWKRLFVKSVTQELDMGRYTSGQGEYGLRVQIARYIMESRGVKCDPKQIIISSGFGQSMELLAKILKPTHRHFAMEEPGYYVPLSVFESYEYTVTKIPVFEEGLSIKHLKETTASLVYITPSHQYPTGVAMPISKRMELLSWAQKYQGYIIEDDYDSEMSYYNRPIPSLQGLDTHGKVVYVGTFSKSLSPSLRVGYMVLPEALLPIYDTYYDKSFPNVDLMTQKTLEKFMEEGHWERHLRKIRTLNKQKHHLLKDLLLKHLSKHMNIICEGGGLSIVIYPTCEFDWDKLEALAFEHSMKVYFAKRTSGGNWQGVRMGFGGLKKEDLSPAIELFSVLWKQCCIS